MYVKRIVCSLVCVLCVGYTFSYTPGSRDREVMQRIDSEVENANEQGGKERLISLVSRLLERTEDIQDEKSLFILEYTIRRIDMVMQASYGFGPTREALYEGEIDMSLHTHTEKKQEGADGSHTQDESGEGVIDMLDSSATLETFFETYKGKVTSSVPISDLCLEYFDEIDTIAKEYDFPTAVIIATWFREHTCKFYNPSNGRGNFQITSHSYPAGEITREQFENQVINFIYFSKAKRERYDAIQTFGPEPVNLSYDHIDLTSLRKQAILYNGVVGTLEDNVYANQNFGMPSEGKDGIVAMTLRALEWQLYNKRTSLLYERGTSIEDENDEEATDDTPPADEEDQDEVETEAEKEIETYDCDNEVFTVNLGSGANHPEVLTMQQFLEEQGLYSGTPNGIYDEKTIEAVNAFQAFYKADILDPGGYTAPTGYRYPATRRKANALVCE